jgi:hypothetical protein
MPGARLERQVRLKAKRLYCAFCRGEEDLGKVAAILSRNVAPEKEFRRKVNDF